MRRPLRSPSGSTRGSRKQVRPSVGVGEREEQVAHRGGAEPLVPGEDVGVPVPRARHGWCSPARPTRPASRSWPSRPAGHPWSPAGGGPGRSCRPRAAARTARPARGRAAGPGWPRRSWRSGSHGRARPAPRRRTWRRGPRAHRAAGSAQGAACRPWPTAVLISACQAGWNSTSSIRLPHRSWLRSTGGCSLASLACSPVAAEPARRPSACSSAAAQPAPSRVTASSSAGSSATS